MLEKQMWPIFFNANIIISPFPRLQLPNPPNEDMASSFQRFSFPPPCAVVLTGFTPGRRFGACSRHPEIGDSGRFDAFGTGEEEDDEDEDDDKDPEERNRYQYKSENNEYACKKILLIYLLRRRSDRCRLKAASVFEWCGNEDHDDSGNGNDGAVMAIDTHTGNAYAYPDIGERHT